MFRTTLIAATLAVTFGAAQAADKPLQMKVYNADGNSFHVNSTLIYGEKEAIVIDAGFTRADALRIAANVLDSGKQLKTIFVSQADPDYYFGVEVLKEIFPNAQVLAAPAVLAKISAKLDGKVAFWGPKMGANAPKKPVLPQALQGDTLTVDGEKLEVRGLTGKLAHRPYVWVPSMKAIVGDIGVFAGLHVWTADTQNAAERGEWIAQLDEMAALKPAIVVPGHMLAGSKMDISAINYTKAYLQSFEKNAAAAGNSAELIDSMKRAYPDAGLGIALDIGAKVNKGEMKW
ncbi:MBL fold metallo-hydrolase [Chitinibacter bivalviorum]|uniref:MBL fold metallo-hydrolase n=1 Tax=Chitinibacter bivalviorum TaxID=2739434 RepID=A0A7H9BKN7_9NEIS|nr:MBL fold metallo-hydrolase [Chitinibacter bivalviorum]QLG89059.1 MBL fold metallo-hydrolase [Chitinibacter bivalviorum]